MLSFRLINFNLRSSCCSFFFRILILTSCSSFKCPPYTFSIFLSLPCSLIVSESQFSSFVCFSLNGFLLARSLKFSCQFPIQASYLGPLEGTIKLTSGCLSHWRHFKHQGCVHLLGSVLSPESIPPTTDTREGFSFPSISVISSSTSVASPINVITTINVIKVNHKCNKNQP